MVKFQVRSMKKRYKRKDYNYKKYLMEFPVKVNPQIEPHLSKDFDEVEITSKENINQEILNISLIRNKSVQQPEQQKRPPQ